MATNSRDVSLIIRAKDEAAKAFDSASAALENLLSVGNKVGDSAAQTGSRLEDLASIALTLDKAYSKVSGSADNAAAAFGRQQAKLTESKDQLAALKAQAEAAAGAIERLRSAEAISAAGSDQTGRIKQLQFLFDQYDLLVGQQNKLTASIDAQQSAMDGQQSSLQRIGSTAIAAADAQARVAAEITLETEAMQKQVGAATALSEIQQRINSLTGAGSINPNGQQAGQSAVVLAEVAARDQLLQKLKAEEAATTALAVAQAAQKRAATLLPGSGIAGGGLSGGSAAASASVFTAADTKANEEFEAQILANVAATKAMDASVANLRAQLNPLALVEEKLNQEIANATSLYNANRISASELAQATSLLNANAVRARAALGQGANGKPALFGLKPFELQNLSFQINDILTQLASGTSITQTLAQQGGQIFQIFPKAGAAIVAAFTNPLVLGFAAFLGSIILGVKKITDQTELLRHFQGVLAATADGTEAQATALANASDALDHFGLSATDAIAIVTVFNKEGVNPARLIDFGHAAKDMADVLGIKVADAAKQVADAFTGTYSSVKKLDDGLNFLTATQRDHIKALFDEGKSQLALNEAFDRFASKQDEGAKKMRGPWTDAVHSLSGAWESFLNFLSTNTAIVGIANSLDTLALSITGFLNSISGIRNIQTIGTEIALLQKKINDVKASQASTGDIFGLKQLEIDNLTAGIKALEAEQKKLADQAKQTPTGDTTGGSAERQKKATEDLIAATDELIAKNKEQGDAERLAAAEKTARLEADQDIQKDNLKFADQAAKDAYVQQKVSLARQAVEKDITEEKLKQQRADEAAIKSFSSKVVGVESGGNTLAQNPNSSAQGLGQFTEATWLDLFHKFFPAEAAQMGTQAILDLRKDAETSKKLIELYARQNAETLQAAGKSVTEANLYLTHFLGASGALKVLNATANTPISELLSQQQIDANKSILQGKTAGDVRQFAADKFNDASASSAASAVAQRLAAIENDRLATQQKFDAGIADENEKRKLGIDSLTKENALQGLALIAEQRKQAVAEAILAKQQEIDKINADRVKKGLPEIKLTEDEKAAVEDLAGSYFDLSHAKDVAAAQRKAAEDPVADLTAQRDAITAQIAALQVAGKPTDGLNDSLISINSQLTTATANAIKFWQAVQAGGPAALAVYGLTADQLQNIIIKLQTGQVEGSKLTTKFLQTGEQINETFAQGATNAVDTFFQNLSNGESVLSSLRDAFLSFAADFLKKIADMILEQAIFNAISGASGGGGAGGGLGGFISGLIGGGVHHKGGLVGNSSAPTRTVDSRWFQNAMRYHNGGIAGLKPGEVPAILKRNEEVLTENDPRHVANGGGVGGGSGSIKNIVVLDPADLLSKGLSTKAGEKVFITFVKENSGALKAALE